MYICIPLGFRQRKGVGGYSPYVCMYGCMCVCIMCLLFFVLGADLNSNGQNGSNDDDDDDDDDNDDDGFFCY